nr:uncharacterized protein LOC129430825 [Misgurnus anguillicaudatus]
MAEPAKKKKGLMSEEAKKRKREHDRERARTRVNIGRAYARWRELKEATSCKTDGDLALLLLDFYQSRQVTSTPSKAKHAQPPQLPVSSVTEESDRDRDDFTVLGVQQLDAQEVGVLEASMHSMSIAEEECDSPDEARNDLRNSTIDMDERWTDLRFCEDADSSDEDIAFLQIRPGGAANIEQLHEISLDEAVLDVVMPTAPEDDERDIPENQKVVCEDDLVGKKASIVYHENLNMLATYLQLPIQRCSNINKVTGAVCKAGPPFEVTLKPRGTGVILEWQCPFGHTLWRWNSQPLMKYGMQGGDFMLAINILLSGNNYRKIAFLFKFMQMGMVAEPTFFKIQDAYCIEPVEEFWKMMRADVLNRLKEKDEVVVLGDGRMDSPGHCAQYCTYTTIEQESRDIVHIVSVDKRETNRNSVILEKECFIRTMDALLPEIHVTEVVTDAHPQISALLNPERGKYKAWSIKHSLDIWHAAKNLGKKIRRAGTVRA